MRVGGLNKEKGIRALAWVSFGLAVVAGAALTDTFVGGWISAVFAFAPGWLATVTFVGVAVMTAVDLVVDGIPNQIALYAAMSLPSMAMGLPGRLAGTVTDLSQKAAAQTNDALGQWLGGTSSYVLAGACAVAALLVARRVIAKGR
jgi:hypothetical protein